ALLASQYYNNVTKKRSFYYAPTAALVLPFHIWNSLVEKAGYKLADAPKTWDAFWDFFKPMQQKLRDKGMRAVYALGLQATTSGVTLDASSSYDPDGNPISYQWTQLSGSAVALRGATLR